MTMGIRLTIHRMLAVGLLALGVAGFALADHGAEPADHGVRCWLGNFALAKTRSSPTIPALLSGHPLVLRDESPPCISGAEVRVRHPPNAPNP